MAESYRWSAKVLQHRGRRRIAVYFDYREELVHKFRQLEGAMWSHTLNVWHVPDTESNRRRFGIPEYVKKELSEEKLLKISEYKYWLISRRYSKSTIKTYLDALKTFLMYHYYKPLEEITNEDIIEFNVSYIGENGLSASFQNQVVNSIKLFFDKIENRKLDIEQIHRPKRPKTLPNVLSMEEVKKILSTPINPKHKAMLSLIYSCGLRRGELLGLKLTDIDSGRGVIIIRQAKGNKDRMVPLSAKLLTGLRQYYLDYKPRIYLFEGLASGEKYAERSLEEVLKKAVRLAGIKKPVTLHWLRHSYATHLLERGINLRYIQEILGHKSSRTTEIYTHINSSKLTQIRSPYDDLDI